MFGKEVPKCLMSEYFDTSKQRVKRLTLSIHNLSLLKGHKFSLTYPTNSQIDRNRN